MFKTMRNFIFLSSFMFYALAFSATKPQLKKFSDEQKAAEKILSKFVNAKYIKIDLEKVDSKKILGTQRKTKGTLSISGNKFNLSTEGDRKTEIILNSRKIWLIEYPDLDFDANGKRRITELSKKQPTLAKQIVNLFSSPKSFFTNFGIVDVNKEKNLMSLMLKPNTNELKSFLIVFDKEIGTLHSIRFVDDIDSETLLTFKKFEFPKSMSAKLFEFKKLKTDEVF